MADKAGTPGGWAREYLGAAAYESRYDSPPNRQEKALIGIGYALLGLLTYFHEERERYEKMATSTKEGA